MKNSILKIACLLIALCTLTNSVTVNAIEQKNVTETTYTDILVKAGYPLDNAKSLSMDMQKELVEQICTNPEKVQINTCFMEVDNLSEIEAFFSYSDTELIRMGATERAIKDARRELLELYNLGVDAISRNLNVPYIEASLIHRAIEKGKQNLIEHQKQQKATEVFASGSISSSKLSYVQSVSGQSLSSTAPEYSVMISFEWKSPYVLAIFDDVVAAAWGGNLNSKNLTSQVRYYSVSGSNYTDFFSHQAMEPKNSPNCGLELHFPQAVQTSANNGGKAKTGIVNFRIYQNYYIGLDTKIVSQYGHQTISLTGASVTIAGDGVPVQLTFSSAYDQSPQASSNITY